MKRYLLSGLLAMAMFQGCGSVTVCDCAAEAKQENPDRETMAACEELYKGKGFEEIELELERCND